MTDIGSAEKNVYLNFLEESFPNLKNNILRCEKLGFQWESSPFFKKEGDEFLAHAGFLEYPMLIEGRLYQAGALHAVCTKSTHRGQGFASELIQEALSWAKKLYAFVILFTEIPKFYEKLSFKHVQEYRFHLKCHRTKGFRRLIPITAPQDIPLFVRCFHNRIPNSNHLWTKDNGNITAFNALFATYPTFWSLYYSLSIDGLVSWLVEDKTLHLFDIIVHKIPTLDLILEHLPQDIDEIYFYFSPDLLTKDAIAEPVLCDNKLVDFSGHLMVHGNWPIVKPFMIPPLSRC